MGPSPDAANPPAIAYHRIRAPSSAGKALLVPLLTELPSLLATNRAHLANPRLSWLLPLAAEARPALLFAAANYTSQYRNASSVFSQLQTGASPSIILAGHQPQLFHAGVWFKNFVLSSVAKEHKAIGVNLIVDNDTLATPSIRVPAGDVLEPRSEFVAFDSSSDIIPFEERSIQDSTNFDTFETRVHKATQAWLPRMLLNELWPLAKQAAKRTRNLGYAISEARHAMEGQWGLETLEVPLSTVYSQTSFQRFILRLLLDLPRFRETYNRCLLEYRQVNHIRSRSHPVPDLADEDGWLETPFWIWSREKPRRQRLFARAYEKGVELSDLAALRLRLPLKQPDDSSVLEQFAALENRGIKIRPRALITTMYARLVLSDLFIHGIGGAKYDELTDAIIRGYFEIDPPQYLTATATCILPLKFSRVEQRDLLTKQSRLREMEFHAERFIAPNPFTQRKQALLADMPPRGSRLAWHAELTGIQHQLQEATLTLRRDEEQQLTQLREQFRTSRLLSSREFAFCLFPEEFLRPLLLDLCQRKS